MTREQPESTITPEIDVSNLETSLEFYVDLLGFEVSFARPEEKFAYLLWNGAGFMIEEIGAGRSFHNAPLEQPYGRGVNFQIRVADVRALHGRLQDAGTPFVLPLEERWYRQGKSERGNRQFVVADPDGYLLRFFEDIGTRARNESMPIDIALRELLAAAPGGGFSLERIERADFGDVLLRPLHAFGTLLMAEPYEHFAAHAATNDELHVFRRLETGVVEGFQFWRCLPGATDRARLVLGGKLRVRPSARRLGLHLCSGLAVLLDQQRRFPTARITRLGVASLFGFVSIARRLARYAFVDVSSRADLIPFVDEVTRASHYTFDPSTGQVEVGIFVTVEQLAGYPASYFESAPARAYLARNPDCRSNGRYLAFAFDVDRANIDALAQGAATCALGAGTEAKAFGERLTNAWASR